MIRWKLVDTQGGRGTPCETPVVPKVDDTIRIMNYDEDGCHAWFLVRQVIHYLIAPSEPGDIFAESWGIEVRCKRQDV